MLVGAVESVPVGGRAAVKAANGAATEAALPKEDEAEVKGSYLCYAFVRR